MRGLVRFFREMTETTALQRRVSHPTCGEHQGSPSSHLARYELVAWQYLGPWRGESPRRGFLAWGQTAVLSGGNAVPPFVRSSIQHVDTSGVHMLGHLEDSVELVVQGRLVSRSRQRIVTRSQSNFVCTHNDYWYTSTPAQRKCANHTITRPRRGQRVSPLDRPSGYPRK